MKILFALALALTPLCAQDSKIDTQRSSITIHVGKAGLLSAAGHEHWVNAPIASGSIGESGAPHVEFSVETASMRVKPDPKVDSKTEATIQKDMETMTLEIAKYPEISFRSTRVEKTADGWKVDGALSLHGVTKPVSVVVKKNGDSYAGHTVLKQTDFGIKPISVAGGTIKVKNEIEIDFQVFRQ
jgi:polyisoprenoid-binding protein YceI